MFNKEKVLLGIILEWAIVASGKHFISNMQFETNCKMIEHSCWVFSIIKLC